MEFCRAWHKYNGIRIRLMNKACFLDRDGVVNVEVDYLYEPGKVEIVPGTVEALKKLKELGFLRIVVTNQAGVARGMYQEKDIHAVHQRIRELLAEQGADVDEFFYCPHHEKFTGECACRKPAPGMLLAAAAKYDIDMARSFMVGDRLSDLEAGRNAGCAVSYLVRTGYGEKVLSEGAVSPEYPVADDLLSAVEDFVRRGQ